ncbi:hypothetical protein [Paraburkholderia sp. BL10I2N1]|uniref:hypothetical protein n=1 Tax=Paraburkholderia sp. BL10I2N1 TaxID=1938796 RepID=UPI00105FB7AF|nr:hypothetical protein [Paraburkholderia sp. BL10I2N1]TDN69078.1 hypothetical protein B0G77_2447 [Paraburkholderia sp. BL10I2N1]
MAELNAALLAFVGVLVGGYFNNFMAEDYRRFRDSQALAGALVGELQAHVDSLPHMKNQLKNAKANLDVGGGMETPEWTAPMSPIFDANAAKIGLLRPNDAKGVAHAYEQIRAFRETLHMLSKHHGGMSANWRVDVVNLAIAEIEKVETIVTPLFDSLTRYADACYWKRRATLLQGGACLLLVAILIALTAHSPGTSEHGEQCTTTLDHDALHTVCK